MRPASVKGRGAEQALPSTWIYWYYARSLPAETVARSVSFGQDDSSHISDLPVLATVQARLFGGFIVDVQGRTLQADAWPRRTARQLLKCLLTRPQRRLLKEEAIELLWPNGDVATGSANLRSTLTALRKALEPVDLIVVDRDGIGIRPGVSMWTDVDAFQDALRRARADPDPLHLLEKANALYSGDYLPEDLYQDWAAEPRERLRRAWTELQRTLARLYEERGELQSALSALDRLLEADACNEQAVQDAMQLLARHERRPEAVRIYQRLTRSLRDELDVEPSPRTVQLYKSIVDADAEQQSTLLMGTLTFLLDEIEGSADLWEAQPDTMREARTRYDTLFERFIHEHGGVLLGPDSRGDSHYAMFSNAQDAITSACAVQVALQQEPWKPARPLRVRMALHTGDADPGQDDAYGSTLQRCIRLRALGHGGQVLISSTTASLLLGRLPRDSALRKLGAYRLRDMLEPEAVFQLVHPALPQAFPPLHAPEWWRGRLPRQPNVLIGRWHEMEELRTALRQSDGRLLTLVGPGGVGKTRLAVAVAETLEGSFPDGVLFADLAPLHDHALVIPSIAGAMGLREASDQSTLELLRDYVGHKQMLLVLDNWEHVLEAASDLAAVLEAGSGFKVLATSREPLHLRWERIYDVPPLANPQTPERCDVDSLGQVPAVELFVERAQAADRGFKLTAENASTVAELCERLDGLPLAIELAAARMRGSTPSLLLRQLGIQLGDGRGARDAPARHQSLWAVTDWSYSLLSGEQQSLFRQIGMYPGGCTPASLAALADPGTSPNVLVSLASLVDKSLLRQEFEPGREPRYRMLETIREYAMERLGTAGEQQRFAVAQAAYFVSLAEQSESEIRGPLLMSWLERLDQEHENIRAVLRLADQHGHSETILRLGAALWYYWHVRARLREGRFWLERGLTAACTVPAAVRAKALHAAGAFAADSGDVLSARLWFQEALELRERLDEPTALAVSLNSVGVLSMSTADYAAAHDYLEQALRLVSRLGEPWRIALVVGNLGWLAQTEGDFVKATELQQESLTLWQSLGNKEATAAVLVRQAWVQRCRGDRITAEALVEEGLSMAREVGSHDVVAFGLLIHGLLRADDREPESAATLLQQSLELYREAGEERPAVNALEGLADVALLEGDAQRAVYLLAATDSLRQVRTWPRHYAERVLFERRLSEARRMVDETQFEADWARGSAMSYTHAVDYAASARA